MNNKSRYNVSNKLLVLIVSTLALAACKHQQKVAEAKPRCSVDFKTAKYLSEQLKAKEFHFNTFDAKIDVEANIDSTSHAFVVNLRMRKDSIIWMSLSKVGVEAARVLITKDSVFFLNRLNKQYFKGNFAYLSKLLNTQLDYEILQSLLVGNSVSFYDDDEKLKASISECQYLLGTIRKRKLKKVVEKGKELREPAQSIYLNPETFKIVRILFYEFDLDRSFDAKYSEFTAVDSLQSFPVVMNYYINAQKNININLRYQRQKVDGDVTFSFKIPDSYEEIIYKEK